MKFFLTLALSATLAAAATPVFSQSTRNVTVLGTNKPAAQGALSISLYLTDALHLTQTQAQAVRQCTQRELERLLTAADGATQDHQQYDADMAKVLTPEQLKHFLQLEGHGALNATISRVLASR